MGQLSVRARVMLASIFMLVVLVSTAYLQTIFHFNTYLALAICLADTVVSATILFSR